MGLLLMLGIPLIIWMVVNLVNLNGAYDKEEWGILTLICGFLMLALLICTVSIPYSHGSELAEMRIFYTTNVPNYETTIDNTIAILSDGDFVDRIMDGNIEKTGLGGAISDRLADLTLGVNEYNSNLASYRYRENSFLMSIFYPSSEGLNYIELQK